MIKLLCLSIGTFLVLPSVAAKKVEHYEDTPESHRPHWGYVGQVGENLIFPHQWHNVNKQCASTKRQSPLNLKTSRARKKKNSLQINYPKELSFSVFHNRHTVQSSLTDKRVPTIKINGKQFDLVQFHIHTPSEHILDGKNYPLEVHFVHKSKAGNFAVLGVLVETASKSDVLHFDHVIGMYDANRDVEDPVQMKLPDVTHLFPKHKNSFILYKGSLTTPPCSENVTWIVFKNTLKLTHKQFLLLHSKKFDVGFVNARPAYEMTKNHDVQLTR